MNADAFRPAVVAYRNGAPVRLSDVANVIDGTENDQLAAWMNLTPAVIMNVQRQPGANIIEVVDRIKKLTPAEKLSLSEPHAFLVGTDTVAHPATPSVAALMKDIAHEAQDQIAAFFNSKDKIPIPIDPDGAGSLFETPAVLPNPMDFGFIFLP